LDIAGIDGYGANTVTKTCLPLFKRQSAQNSCERYPKATSNSRNLRHLQQPYIICNLAQNVAQKTASLSVLRDNSCSRHFMMQKICASCCLIQGILTDHFHKLQTLSLCVWCVQLFRTHCKYIYRK